MKSKYCKNLMKLMRKKKKMEQNNQKKRMKMKFMNLN